VSWWQNPPFSDEAALRTAELVAFDVLDPALRSRGNPTAAALALYEESKFKSEMEALFRGPPTGRLVLPNLQDLAYRVESIERRLAALESSATRK
jgi:hypothetical protein